MNTIRRIAATSLFSVIAVAGVGAFDGAHAATPHHDGARTAVNGWEGPVKPTSTARGAVNGWQGPVNPGGMHVDVRLTTGH